MHASPILYVEDEENDVFFMQRAFNAAKVINPLVVASDGKQAMDYIAGKGKFSQRSDYPMPCLLLLDLNLPIRSGLEVLKWIRSQPALCAMPVLVLTSSNQESDIRGAYLEGANGYLIKPATPEDLVVMVQAIKSFWLCQNHAINSA